TSEEDNGLFYNPWEEVTSPAIYLTDIEEVLTKKDTEANPTIEEQIEKFLQNNALDKEEKKKGFGKTTITSHQIDTGRAKPIKQRAYRAAPNEYEFIEKKLKEIEEREIQPDESKVEKKVHTWVHHIARSLHHLMQKKVSFRWEQEQQGAFEALKDHLTIAPILKYPDFDDRFYLYTDASGTGLGAVLAQKDESKKKHVIFYASRSLSKAERNYSACELECLAVIWAVEYYYHYFGFKPFIIIMDHSALKSGNTHMNADVLSRINETEEEIEEVYTVVGEIREHRLKENEEENQDKRQTDPPK
ncbi:8258_t:CDS:2, partial [Racocetra persica]